MSANLWSMTRASLIVLCWIAVAITGCKKKEITEVPDTFNSLSTEEKMALLMKKLPPDSIALFVCDAVMDKKSDNKIDINEAISYAYLNYKEEEQIEFGDAISQYGRNLPLNEQMKFFTLTNLTEDPDAFGYQMGLHYVGTIREEGKDAKQVKEEIDRFMKECENDRATYKRFIKGFKIALQEDRGKDLDEKIYTQFISYPDSIQ